MPHGRDAGRLVRGGPWTRNLALAAALAGCADGRSPAPSAEGAIAPPDTWVGMAAPHGEIGQSVTLLPDGRWLVVGGAGGVPSDAVFVATDAFAERTSAGTLRVSRTGQTATALPGGRVLILGGLGPDGELVEESEWYLPGTGKVEQAPKVKLQPRAFHTATLLTDGRVMIAGGRGRDGQPTARVELLDPVSLTVTSASDELGTPRAGHTANLLPDGTVLLRGGDGAAEGQETSEVFQAETGRLRAIAVDQRRALLVAAEADEHLAIVASIPARGAAGVASDAQISVRFSKRVVPQSVTAQGVTLRGPQGAVRVAWTVLEAGRLLFVRPERSLLPATYYTLYLSGLADRSGHVLPLSTVEFTTASVDGTATADSGLPAPSGSIAAATALDAGTFRPVHTLGPDGLPRWTPPGPASADDDGWLPNEDNLRGRWHRGKPEVTDPPPLVAPAGVTALYGLARRLNGEPLAGVQITVGQHRAVTDDLGRFLLADLPAGGQVLEIDAMRAGRGAAYGLYYVHVDLEEGTTTSLPYTVWLTKLDPQGTVKIPSPTVVETVLTSPSLPGLEVRIPAGTVIRDKKGKTVTELNLTAIPTDQPPFPTPDLGTPIYFTIQPGGAVLQGLTSTFRGARLIYPNFRGELPGVRGYFWNYDAVDRGWYVYGIGTVSPDGSQVFPDPDVAIYEFTGAMFGGLGVPPPGRLATGGSVDGTGSGSRCNDHSPDSNAGGNCPGDGQDGEPVQLNTGQLLRDNVDIGLPDVISIMARRVYNSNDLAQRQFGVGMTGGYDYRFDPPRDFANPSLVQPDGSRVPFRRINAGTEYRGADFISTAPGIWYGAKLTWTQTTYRTGWILAFRNGWRWFFREYGPLAEIRDRNGNTVTIKRAYEGTIGSDAGPVTRVESSNGKWLAFTLDLDRKLTRTIVDSGGRTVLYNYDAQSRLTSVRNVTGGLHEFTYGADNRLSTVKDPNGTTVLQTLYEPDGRVRQQTLADGSRFLFTYQMANDLVTSVNVTQRTGLVRRVEFDGNGAITKDTFAFGTTGARVTYFNRDANSRLLDVTDFNARKTAFGYDDNGNLSSVTYLSGTSEAVTYTSRHSGPYNLLERVTDPLNRSFQFSYDIFGNLVQVTNPLGELTKFVYDTQGRLTRITDGFGQVTSVTYSGAYPTSITSPGGSVTQVSFDSAGRLVGSTSPTGAKRQWGYDAAGRLTSALDPLGNLTALTYTRNGSLSSLRDALGRITNRSYNSLGLIRSETDPLGRPKTYTYDPSGRLGTITDRKGLVTAITYDPLGRVSKIDYGGAAAVASPNTIVYGYDTNGRLSSAAETGGATVSWTYDQMDRVRTETTPAGTVSYTYDAAGQVKTRTAPGQATTFTFDGLGRIDSIAQNGNSAKFSYDAAGRRTRLVGPGGLVTTYSYDGFGRPAQIAFQKSGMAPGDLSYAYDADDNVIGVSGTLARVALPAPITSLGYDVTDRLTLLNGQPVSHDSNGNLTAAAGTIYKWDARNRLTDINGTGLVAQFSYLPDGRRLTKTVNGTVTRYLYSGLNSIQEQSAAGAMTANLFVGTGIDHTLSRTTPASGTVEFGADRLGTVLGAVTGGGQSTVYTYTPHGKSTASGPTYGNTQTFTGREDDGTGLLYFRARYYNPSTGRFISQDPIGITGGSNLYLYARAAPTMFRDPLGLETLSLQANLDFVLGGGFQLSAGAYYDTSTLDFGAYSNFSLSVGFALNAGGSAAAAPGSICAGQSSGRHGGAGYGPLNVDVESGSNPFSYENNTYTVGYGKGPPFSVTTTLYSNTEVYSGQEGVRQLIEALNALYGVHYH